MTRNHVEIVALALGIVMMMAGMYVYGESSNDVKVDGKDRRGAGLGLVAGGLMVALALPGVTALTMMAQWMHA